MMDLNMIMTNVHSSNVACLTITIWLIFTDILSDIGVQKKWKVKSVALYVSGLKTIKTSQYYGKFHNYMNQVNIINSCMNTWFAKVILARLCCCGFPSLSIPIFCSCTIPRCSTRAKAAGQTCYSSMLTTASQQIYHQYLGSVDLEQLKAGFM